MYLTILPYSLDVTSNIRFPLLSIKANLFFLVQNKPTQTLYKNSPLTLFDNSRPTYELTFEIRQTNDHNGQTWPRQTLWHYWYWL